MATNNFTAEEETHPEGECNHSVYRWLKDWKHKVWDLRHNTSALQQTRAFIRTLLEMSVIEDGEGNWSLACCFPFQPLLQRDMAHCAVVAIALWEVLQRRMGRRKTMLSYIWRQQKHKSPLRQTDRTVWILVQTVFSTYGGPLVCLHVSLKVAADHSSCHSTLGPIITELICRVVFSCYYGKVRCWTQLQCCWGKEGGRRHVAALAWVLAALGSTGRGKGGGNHGPPRVFPRILPTYKAIFDLGCME